MISQTPQNVKNDDASGAVNTDVDVTPKAPASWTTTR